MSKDLEEFAKYFTGTLNMGLGHVDKYFDRQEKREALRQKAEQYGARESRENRKTDQWIAQSQDYMKTQQAKRAALAGKVGKAGPGNSAGFLNDMQKEFPHLTPGTVAPPPVNNISVSSENDGVGPAMPASEGDGLARGGTVRRFQAGGTTGPGSGFGTIAAPPGMRRGGRVPRFADGGMMSLEEASQGGPGGKKSSTNAAGAATAAINTSDSAMGRAADRLGRWAATRKSTPDVGSYGQGGGGYDGSEDRMARGGTVRRFQAGGMEPYAGDDLINDRVPVDWPRPEQRYEYPRNTYQGALDPPTTPYQRAEQRQREEAASARSSTTAARNQTPERSRRLTSQMITNSDAPPEATMDEIKGRGSNSGDGSSAIDVGRAGPSALESDAGWRERPSGPRGQNDSPDQYYRDDVRAGATRPWPSGAGGGSRGGGGGGGGGGAPRGGDLGDPRREKAYDPIADYADPRNIHAVDRWGRSRSAGAAPAASAGGAGPSIRTSEGGDGLNPQGSSGQGAGLSTNNVASDLAASQGASNFGEYMFHLGKADANSARGYEALAAGHGAPTIKVIDDMRRAVDPEGKLPPNELMRQLRNKSYEFYMQKGDEARADKAAFEVSQFGNVMAKSHGTNAQKLLAKGDVQGATHEIAAGYNWLPNGHTVHIDPSGQTAVIEGPDGKIIQQMPITPQVLKQVADGMSHGVFNWDVMNGGGALPAPALNEAGAAPQGRPAPGQAIATGAPTLPSPVSQPPPAQPPPQAGAQPPPAAPAGPAPTQAAAPPTALNASPPPAAPSSLAPTTQGGQPSPPAPPQPKPPAAPPPPAVQTAPPPPVVAPPPPAKTEEDPLKPWKDDPNYRPSPGTRIIRRDSDEPTGLGFEDYRKKTAVIEAQYRKDEQKVMQIAVKNGFEKTSPYVQAQLQGLKQEATEKMAKLKEEHGEYKRKVEIADRTEEAGGATRKVGSDVGESAISDRFQKLAENDYQKYKKYKPEEEAKKLKDNPNYEVPAEFSTIHQSPLSYMAKPEDRQRLAAVAQAIWMTNPRMTERTAFDHALTLTSAVGTNDKGVNFGKGTDAKHYAIIGNNHWGHAVVSNKLGEKVHIDNDTLHAIDLLRAKNYEMKEAETKKRQEKADNTVTAGDLLKKGKHLWTGKGKDPNQ